MDDTNSKGSSHGKESDADEQGAQAHLWRAPSPPVGSKTIRVALENKKT